MLDEVVFKGHEKCLHEPMRVDAPVADPFQNLLYNFRVVWRSLQVSQRVSPEWNGGLRTSIVRDLRLDRLLDQIEAKGAFSICKRKVQQRFRGERNC